MATQVVLFLCPSDGAPPPAVGTGPTNYAFCSGDGSNGGDATNADGVFILGPAESVANITDGTSQTTAASEQLLGIAGPYSQPTPTPVPSPWYRAMARVAAAPLTDAACASAPDGWLLNKGSSWWDGNYQNAFYNHYLPPTPITPIASSITTPAGRPPGAFIPRRECALLRRPCRLSKDTVNPGAGRRSRPARGARSSRRMRFERFRRWVK